MKRKRQTNHLVGPTISVTMQNAGGMVAACARYPIEAATRIAIETVARYQSQHDNLAGVIFCCFSDRDLTESLDRECVEPGPNFPRPLNSSQTVTVVTGLPTE